jgi:hypothetical protein
MSTPAHIPYNWLEADFVIPDPGTGYVIPLIKGIGVCDITVVASATETRYLDVPSSAGLILGLNALSVGAAGTCTIAVVNSGTLAGTTLTGFTFTATGQVEYLVSVTSGSSFKWARLSLLDIAQALVGSNYATYMPLAAQQALSGAGAINVTSYYTAWTTTAANAGTLANGVQVGQRKRIQQIVDGGDGTLTPTSLLGGTTITFADAGDFAELIWNGTAWVPVQLGNDADGATAPVLA